MGDQLWHAERLHGGQVRCQATLTKRPHLVQSPPIQHEIEPNVDALIKRLAFRFDDKSAPGSFAQQRRRFTVEARQRPAGLPTDFHQTQEALFVGRFDLGRRKWILALGFSTHGFQPLLIQQDGGAGASGGRNLRYRRQANRQGVEIQTGSAHKNRCSAARADLVHQIKRRLAPLTDRPTNGRIHHTEQMMGNGGSLVFIRTGRNDRQTVIDLH